MTTFKVTIPNNKKTFFLEFLKLLGAQYKESREFGFELSEKQKDILDQQENLEISDYRDNDDFLNELKEKYDL